MKKRISIILLVIFLFLVVCPMYAFAAPEFREQYSAVPGIYSPLWGTDVVAAVNSSWNEPRSTEIHAGVDQSVAVNHDIGPVASGTIYSCVTDPYGSAGNYQVIKYTNSSGTYYTVYMHLNSFLKTSGTVYASDKTAKTGNTGNVGAHAHWEVLSSYSSLSNRVTVNPSYYLTRNYETGFAQTRLDCTVYKNWSASNSYSGGLHWSTVSIDAIDKNLGYDNYLNCQICYRIHGTSTWSGPYSMDGGSYGHWTYTFASYDPIQYDVLIIGRRNTTEAWCTFPAKHNYSYVGHGSTFPINSYSDWDYQIISLQ